MKGRSISQSMKNAGILILGILALILFSGLGAGTVRAASYTDWSAWSTSKPEEAAGREIDSRNAVSSYQMVVYVTQESKSPYYRNYREYSIGGKYSQYGNRSSYGEFHYTKTVTPAKIASATKYKNGDYITATVGTTNGYHRGNGTAYYLNDGDVPWFIERTTYVTEYRYRDVIPETVIPDEPGPIADIPIKVPTVTLKPTAAPPAPTATVTPAPSGTTKPAAPEIIDTTCRKDGIKITWKVVNGVTGYIVYRDGKKIATVKGGSKHTYLDKKAKSNGKSYRYSVCAYTKSGSKTIKGAKCKVVVVVYLTVNITPKATSPKSDSITVTWKPNKKCQGYEIWYSKNKKFNGCKKVQVSGGNKKSKKLTGLDANTVYYIKIRVYFIVNGRYSYSPFCSAFHIRTQVKTYVYKGVVTNAQDGSRLKNVTLYFRKGSSKKTGTVYKKCKTDSNGQYKITLPEGTYTVEVVGKNYVTIYITIYVNIDSPSNESNPISISKPLASKQYRVVLTWGSYPYDLDSHLTGPSGANGTRYHVYYSQKDGYYNGKKVANLDVDDVTSYGPETITFSISSKKKGTYTYSVHDFTNRNSTSSTGLGNSGARVMVYNGKKLIATYHVPKKAGTVWKVFSIKNGKLVRHNKMGYAQLASGIK